MSASLLTEHQRRHLATFLQLLTEDLAQLTRLPEIGHPAAPYHRLADQVTAVAARALRIAQDFELTLQPPADASRRVWAVAHVWAARAPELRARNLRGYGPVHPELAKHLDPLIDGLTKSLFALAESASAQREE